MKARSRISKGRNFQKKISSIILNKLALRGNSLVGRPFDETDIHPQRSACAGSDVVMNTSVLSIFPFDVECKKGNSTTLEEAYRQSAKRCPEGLRSLVILEPDRKKAVVFGKEKDIFVGTNEEALGIGGRPEDFITRKGRNKDSLYDIWYKEYKSNPKHVLYSLNSLIDDDEDWFVQIEFTYWLDLWVSFLVE